MSLLGRQSPDERDERLGGSRTGPALKEANIYIPNFITKRPFYTIDESEEATAATDDGAAGTSQKGQRDYLEHQRAQKKKEDTKWYQRGKTLGPAATKYRKGACENCGSMSHKRRDCFSRPRAKLAKYTNEDIQPDEVIEDVNLGWDAKRDRWIGFDPRDYAAMMAQREKLNDAKRVLQGKLGGGEGGAGAGANEGAGAATNEGAGEDNQAKASEDSRYTDSDIRVSRQKGTADLRVREDTARYLVNLDVDSAQYDPKRRKIVDGGAYVDDSARLFAEQNFAKTSGDVASFKQAQQYAWEVHDKTGDASLHLQANPTAAEQRRKQDRDEARRKQQELDAIMLKKYGVTASGGADVAGDDDDARAARTKAARLATAASSERFVEYDESGHVKETLQAKRVDTSKYAEDVFPLNHTTVWGSWWHNFQWGYACCASFVRNSYCTGAEGRLAFERAERQRAGDWGGGGGGSGDGSGDNSASGSGAERKMLTAPEDDTETREPSRRRRHSSPRDD